MHKKDTGLSEQRILEYRIGEYLGVHPDALGGLLGSRDIAEFGQYFEWVDTRTTRADYYGALIAGYCSGKKEFRLDEFMANRTERGGYAMSPKEAIPILQAMYGKPESISDSADKAVPPGDAQGR